MGSYIMYIWNCPMYLKNAVKYIKPQHEKYLFLEYKS
jgi:hypothetical protein